jgi:hypothetical protein
MHSKRRPAAQAGITMPTRRAAELRAWLDRLVDNLDDSSLRAALKLMLCEAHGAIRRQHGLIELERLDGRDISGRTDRLRELELVHEQLSTLYASHAAPQDEVADEAVVEETAHLATGTSPCSFNIRGVATLRTREREEVYVGRISAAALERELACAEPAPVRNRQGRHGSRTGG